MSTHLITVLSDEGSTAAWVLRNGEAVELYDLTRTRGISSKQTHHVIVRSTALPQAEFRLEHCS